MGSNPQRNGDGRLHFFCGAYGKYSVIGSFLLSFYYLFVLIYNTLIVELQNDSSGQHRSFAFRVLGTY